MAFRRKTYTPACWRPKPQTACLCSKRQGSYTNTCIPLGTWPAHRPESFATAIAALSAHNESRSRVYAHFDCFGRCVYPCWQAATDSTGRCRMLWSLGRPFGSQEPWCVPFTKRNTREARLCLAEAIGGEVRRTDADTPVPDGYRHLASVRQGGESAHAQE